MKSCPRPHGSSEGEIRLLDQQSRARVSCSGTRNPPPSHFHLMVAQQPQPSSESRGGHCKLDGCTECQSGRESDDGRCLCRSHAHCKTCEGGGVGSWDLSPFANVSQTDELTYSFGGTAKLLGRHVLGPPHVQQEAVWISLTDQKVGQGQAWLFIFVIATLRKPRQEDYYKSKTNLINILSSRLIRAT